MIYYEKLFLMIYQLTARLDFSSTYLLPEFLITTIFLKKNNVPHLISFTEALGYAPLWLSEAFLFPLFSLSFFLFSCLE